MNARLRNTCIYEIRDVTTGRFYIGSACNFPVRKGVHLRGLREGNHRNRHLQESFNRAGEGNLVFKRLVVCKKEDLLFYEQRLMDGLKPEMNIHRVAGSPQGYRHSEETLAKMRAVWANRTQEQKDAILKAPRRKTEHTEEFKQKLAVFQSRRVRGDEEREKIGRAFAKFTDEEVREMRKLRADGLTYLQISKMYGADTGNISLIIRGKTYKWV